VAAELSSLADWDARVNHVISSLVSAGITAAEASSDLRLALTSFCRRMSMAYDYRPSSALRSSTRVTLVRAADSWQVAGAETNGEDYDIRDVCDGEVDIHVLPGTHDSFITEPDSSSRLARLLDEILSGYIHRAGRLTSWIQL